MTAGGWRRSRIWREARPFVMVALGVAAYGLLRVVFVHVVGSQGFVTPSGSPGMGLVAFAVVMLVMRITVLVAVPLIITYRVVQRLLGRERPRDTPAEAGPDR